MSPPGFVYIPYSSSHIFCALAFDSDTRSLNCRHLDLNRPCLLGQTPSSWVRKSLQTLQLARATSRPLHSQLPLPSPERERSPSRG
jgi:hypothetical protein